MNFHDLHTIWAPRVLSVLRIVAALLFMEHGTQKLLGFPPSPNPGPTLLSIFGIAGLLELIGGALLAAGLFTRPVAFILSGDGGRLLDGARTPQLLSSAQRRGTSHSLLLRVPLSRVCGWRSVEHRRIQETSGCAAFMS
jgi:putative oxidoreductase